MRLRKTTVPRRAGLFDAEQVTTVFIDHLQRATTPPRHAGEGIFGDDHRQAGFCHEQAIQIAQQGAPAGEHHAALGDVGALLRDFDRLLMEETGLPVLIAEDPLTCVARGGGRALEMIDETGTDVFASE